MPCEAAPNSYLPAGGASGRRPPAAARAGALHALLLQPPACHASPSRLHPAPPAPPPQGTLRTYARLTGPCDPPAAVGLEMSASLQDGLPGPKEVRCCRRRC